MLIKELSLLPVLDKVNEDVLDVNVAFFRSGSFKLMVYSGITFSFIYLTGIVSSMYLESKSGSSEDKSLENSKKEVAV
eukprot:snap_masked-scaffold_17-processed-gene-4.17-mRNA-1 protein AED:1.00 eAED:1.00 QI:0/-1/0/0/-1/1/1/0/77